ncbi:MAG: hypothetical protein K9N46_09875 [Candidatus Marinimicrobia bacterium]|nr:hypothetical protein [Candidatus Neomarinimicrobiota bacterium]MCF7828375.1 hypothetical protein [Candidatus Neomarinimicrobiota bacterium]MCF7881031.1 hypothetical protein [Candidatus Neomarinimicrobiota bacterium]
MKKKNRPLSREAQRKFLDQIEGEDPEKCWRWTGSFMREDYPLFYGDGRQEPALRILYRIYYKNNLTKDWVIQHNCGNRWCMNPNHIYADRRDEAAKEIQRERRRFTRGENHPQAQLTEEDVRRIRRKVESGALQKELAEEYGVTKTHISNIVRGKAWSHVK